MPIIYDPDLVAFAGTRIVSSFLGDTVDNIIVGLGNALAAGGWTLIDTGTFSGHPFRKYISQRSPWVASTPQPLDYGGFIKVLIRAYDTLFVRISASNFDDTIQQPSTPGAGDLSAVLQKTAPGDQFRAIVCPYRCIAWTPGFFNILVPNVVWFEAPHTPAFLQDGFGLRECLYCFTATTFRQNLFNGVGFTGSFFAIKDSAGTFAWSGQANDNSSPRFLIPFGGNFAQRNACWVANLKDDPTLANPDRWYPLATPPAFGWGRTNAAGPLAWKCFPFDCFMHNRQHADDATITTPDGHVFKGLTINNIGGSGVPGTLFFCTSGPT